MKGGRFCSVDYPLTDLFCEQNSMPHSFIAPEGEIPQQNADKNAADIEDEINEEAGKTTKKTEIAGVSDEVLDRLCGRGYEERYRAK